MSARTQRLLTIASTKLYTELDAGELHDLHDELVAYTSSLGSGVSESAQLTLLEMLFYVKVYLSKDVDAQVIYNTLRDRFGEHSPSLYVMKATLLQINEGDQVAIDYIEKLIKESLEYDTDAVSYLLLQKKLLSIKASSHDKEWLLKQVLSLIEKFPLDPELYWFAAKIYTELGQFDRAAYCYEEVLCIMPFNYVAFGQLAESLYYKALKNEKLSTRRRDGLQKALENALRSVELSENYLKGWSFVAMISKKLDGRDKIFKLARSKIQQIADSSNAKNKATANLLLKNL
ncbi:hypothetical protein HG536_0B04010 [Torulaspora globosa]|uniref:ER membrane protein complex subunit 2 n=1 Tax=Torulaspora globosa TaxID=48254 RepID=A0A7G3ZDF1_9SACH|nr:uncharacterized protein HG536_0B04010 [Torulaspora globosa]QLL31537.1 hypothetical protein HG536_0B04010 [Torulaspora globosa]